MELRERVKAALIEALRQAGDEANVDDHGDRGVLIDGWFDLDRVVDAVIAEVRG